MQKDDTIIQVFWERVKTNPDRPPSCIKWVVPIARSSGASTEDWSNFSPEV
jgi:hypothetical protein